jgi:toxin FitB
MILLDTNILSQTMTEGGSRAVIGWLDMQPERALFISTITLAELRAEIERLPPGQRREGLDHAYRVIRDELFRERILAFDAAAAHEYGIAHARRRAAGRPLPVLDGLIAGIARANAMTLATRNTSDFDGLDIVLVNPFAFEVS